MLDAAKIRLISFVFLSLIIYPIHSIKLLFLAMLGSLLLFFVLNTPLKFLKGLIYANTFTVFIVVSLLLLDFKNNLTTALVIFLKSNTILLLTFSLVLPLGITTLIRTLESFKVPKKFTLMVFLSYRYISSIKEEYEKMKKAAQLRGFEPKFNLRTYKIFGYMLGTLTLKTFFKARQVYKAMVCRGFGS